MRFRGWCSIGILLVLSAGGTRAQEPTAARGKEGQKAAREQSEKYYEKWLKEDAAYIITEDEREVFSKLTTDEERDSFIEQFWKRRDPDPSTPINEFKIEHYRRIAYANDHFQSGEPGWKTDRGEIYIKFGPPDGLETHPNGGPYRRRMSEGGGRTTTFPFERWRYNNIEGVGQNIEIEFVDPSRTGEYRIALSPQEKDALLYVQTMGAGKTEGEELGLENRWLRITRDSGLGIESRSLHYAIQPDDFPFEKLQRFAQLQKAPASAKARELRESISSRVTYNTLQFRADSSYVRMSDDRFLVPITVEIPNGDMSYRRNESGYYQADVELYGSVTDPSGRTWQEFDHELFNSAAPEDLDAERGRLSVFQKLVMLPPGRYKVEMIAKDMASGHVGIIQQSLLLPAGDGSLDLSPVVLADLIQRETLENKSEFEQFSLAGLKVVPNVARVFTKKDLLYVYLQAYNVQVDTSTKDPSLEVRYFLMRGKRLIVSFPDVQGNTIDYVSPRRVVLITAFKLASFEPGDYRLEVRVKDKISHMEARTQSPFTLKP